MVRLPEVTDGQIDRIAEAFGIECDAQRRAVLACRDSTDVRACAGSGKTRTLTERVRYSIAHGIPAREICAITFSKRAAEELTARLDGAAADAQVGTIHSLGLAILRAEEPKRDVAGDPARLVRRALWHLKAKLPLKDVVAEISRAKMTGCAFLEEVGPDFVDVAAYYQQNLERFKQGDSVHAAHILIGVPQNATAEQKAEAKTKAAAVLKTIKAGGDFATLARASSSDPGSAQNGGDLGFFPKGQMTPAFEEAAFKLKPGVVSALVETPFGFHIIKVIERRAPRTAPFAEVSGQIKDFLEQGQREQKLEQFVEQVKSKGKIEILV